MYTNTNEGFFCALCKQYHYYSWGYRWGTISPYCKPDQWCGEDVWADFYRRRTSENQWVDTNFDPEYNEWSKAVFDQADAS